jgi:anti-anti-sigma regulatory factor
MAFILEQHETVSDIRLEGTVNIASAAEFKGMLQEALLAGRQLRVDLSKAIDLDICILQLLLCADRQWRQADLSFTLMGPLMDDLASAVANAGLEALRVCSDAGVPCEV